MNSQFEQIILGVITSIITGLGVWVWTIYRKNWQYSRKSKFFGIKRNTKVFLTINNYPDKPNLISHSDTLCLIEISRAISDLKGELIIKPLNEVKFAPGEQVEFCFGGVDSNERTKIFLKDFLPGVEMASYNSDYPLRIHTDANVYDYVKGMTAYVILAKIIPINGRQPIFLICGQTGQLNRAGVYFLEKNYKKLLKKYKEGAFCKILTVNNLEHFGYKAVKEIKDISDLVNRNPSKI